MAGKDRERVRVVAMSPSNRLEQVRVKNKQNRERQVSSRCVIWEQR
jgi:hypothetical protein